MFIDIMNINVYAYVSAESYVTSPTDSTVTMHVRRIPLKQVRLITKK